MTTKSTPSPVYFLNGSWYCKKKCLNENHETVLIEEGGYTSESEAYIEYGKSLDAFNQRIEMLKATQEQESSFLQHLIRWYHNILIPRSDSSTKVVAGYVLYHFLIPTMPLSLQEKILPKVTIEDLNILLLRCNDFCDTSGAQTYRFLNSFFSDCLLDRYIKDNKMKYVKKYYMNDTQKELVVYSREQLTSLLERVYKSGGEYSSNSCFLEIMLGCCGLRLGEIRGLRADDFDEEQETVRIQRQIVKECEIIFYDDNSVAVKKTGVTVKAPKSFSSNRIIRIPKIIIHLVKERMEAIKSEKERRLKRHLVWTDQWSGYLSLGVGGNIKSEGTINGVLRRACCDVSVPLVSIHDLRHMTASWLLELGMPLEDISAFLGHSNTITTWNTYIHYLQSSNKLRTILDCNIDPIHYTPNERRA